MLECFSYENGVKDKSNKNNKANISFLKTVPRRCFFCGSFMPFLSCFPMLSCTSVVDALWSPAEKGLTSWLSFVMSNFDVVTFPLVSWVRCGV